MKLNLPPLEVFLSEDWIAGARSSRTLTTAMSAAVSPAAGNLLDFATLALEGQRGVANAIQIVSDLGRQVTNVVRGASATSIAGFSVAAIQLFTGALFRSIAVAADDAQANALYAQWDIACYLTLRRQAKAGDLPGGANYTNTQPGWKKDWAAPAVPAIPHEWKDYPNKHFDKEKSEWVTDPGTYRYYRRLILFTKGTPNSVEMPDKCFALTDAATAESCAMPDDAQIGLSLLTYPMMVENDYMPWGGIHLAPFAAILTSPSILHVQIREADVTALKLRIMEGMRQMWNVTRGPPLMPNRVTLWNDGYAGPTSNDQKAFDKLRDKKVQDAYKAAQDAWKNSNIETFDAYLKDHPLPAFPFVGAGPFDQIQQNGKARDGLSVEAARYPWILGDIPLVSAAMRQIARFQECRRACLRHFARLPVEVRIQARKNPDFSEEAIARWGGPNGAPPPLPKRPTKVNPAFKNPAVGNKVAKS